MNRIALILIMTLVFAGTAWAEPVLIANPSVTVSEISRSYAAKIYLGKKKKWPDGARLAAIVYKDGAIHDQFVKKIIRKTPSQFSTHWKRLVFTGKGQALKMVSSEKEMIEAVKSIEGALGYIDDATASDGLVRITIK